MQKLQSTFDRLWASLIFFTRLPLWRLHQPSVDAYQSVVECWPLVGWLTGSVMASVLYLGSFVMPYAVAVLLAIVSRMLLTGALHEDGLADFFDGFGGGADRERILAIMKDSHIGTYGVLALILYVAMLFSCLYALPPLMAALVILVADPYAKMLAAQVIQMLPYARNAETAKSHIVYRKYNLWAGISLALQGLLPMAVFHFFMHTAEASIPNPSFSMIYVPALVMYFLYLYIRKRLQGYTGDCCGAMFLLTELSVYLVAAICFV